MKKTIRSHKGGRTDRINIRIMPASKQILEREAERLNISVADLIEKMARKIEEENVK